MLLLLLLVSVFLFIFQNWPFAYEMAYNCFPRFSIVLVSSNFSHLEKLQLLEKQNSMSTF